MWKRESYKAQIWGGGHFVLISTWVLKISNYAAPVCDSAGLPRMVSIKTKNVPVCLSRKLGNQVGQ